MNRFVSLLLVALCLAAVTLAQPAQAQWVQGSLYYDKSNFATLDDNNNTTLTTKPIGCVTLTSTPKGGYYGTNAWGNLGGIIHQDYLWSGDPKSPGTSLTSTDNGTLYGMCTGSGSATSNINSGFNRTTVNSPNQTYSVTSTIGPLVKPLPGNTSTTVTVSYSLGLTTTDSYAGLATASATITFGPPS